MLNPLIVDRMALEYTVSVLPDPLRGLRRIVPFIDQYKNLKNQECPVKTYRYRENQKLSWRHPVTNIRVTIDRNETYRALSIE